MSEDRTTRELLDALTTEWQRLGVPTADLIADGLPPEHVREVLDHQFGSVEPALVDWFAWQGGTVQSGWTAAPLGGLQLWSLDQALTARQEQLAIAAPVQWRKEWLPITDAPTGSMYAIDATVGTVLDVDWWSAEFSRPVACDLTTAVAYWVEVLQRGLYRWTGSGWDYDFASFPTEIRASGLVS